MMDIDIEKYLNDEMDRPERQSFEQMLRADPTLRAELEDQRAFLERLKTQMLREKMLAAIATGGEDNPPEKTTAKSWVWLILPLLLVLVAVVWYFNENQNQNQNTTAPVEEVPIEQPPTNEELIVPPTGETREEKTPPKKSPPPDRPIAENPTVVPPSNTQGVRGDDATNEDWEKLIESVWVTRFEPAENEFNERFNPVAQLLKEKNTTDAFVQLYLLERQSPENDTLAYLKGYCLLEMREGAKALEYFNKIKNKNNWQQNIAWYKSLAYLINSEKENAIREVELIAKNKKHNFYREAEKLLEVFQ